MKAAIYGLVMCAALASGPLGAATASAQTPAAKPDDSTLDSRIEARMHRDAVLKKYDVDVVVEGGVAKLTGKVPTEAARKKATTLATVPGVARVDNRLVVDPNADKGVIGTVGEKTKEAGEKTKDAAGKVAEKTKDGAGKAAEKTKEGVSKTGEVITDAWITTRVKSKFIDEDVLNGSDIDVDTKDHVVTLTGTVPTAAGRARAVQQAKEVEGVHRVVDKLMIGPKKK